MEHSEGVFNWRLCFIKVRSLQRVATGDDKVWYVESLCNAILTNYATIFPLLAHSCVCGFYFDINIMYYYFINIINKIRKIHTNINISVGTTIDNQYDCKSNDVSHQDNERHWKNIDKIYFNNGCTHITDDVSRKFQNEINIIVHISN